MDICLEVAPSRIRAGLSPPQLAALGTYAASQWHRLYAPYTPYRTGMLADTVNVRPWEIEHSAPYARRLYYGDGYHFTRSAGHTLAGARWDRRAAPVQGPRLIMSLQQFADSGRLKLYD